MRKILALVLGTLFFTPSFISAGPLRDAARQEKIFSQNLTQTPSGAFEDWQIKIEKAKNKRNSGRNLMLTGAGISAVSMLLMALNQSNEAYFGGDNPENQFYAVIGLLAGSGTAAVGGWKFVSAKEDISDLEREGRMKGYITLGPATGRGVQASVRLTF